MRAGELLGRPVFDHTGRRIGLVADLRCVQEAGPHSSWGVLRLDALVVTERRVTPRLGYGRHQRSPALLRGVLRGLPGQLVVVPWSAVASWSAEGIRLTDSAGG
ncbi:MAG TPA: PRC-barrel domain-containing protein [Mycobacteriales bacterium]